jgi:phenylalanyl-tRNA synthetase beta chain
VAKECSSLPVVTFPVYRIKELFPGHEVKQIVDMLPYIGLDIEHIDDNEIKVEYSPNRPDYSSYYGIARSLKGLLGIEVGLPAISLNVKKDHIIQVDRSVSARNVRPFIAGLVAKNGIVDEESIIHLEGMQDDLNNGLGRRSTIASISFYDFSKLQFPLRYTTIRRNAPYSQPEYNSHKSLDETLETTEARKISSQMIPSSELHPVLLNNTGVVSTSSIINGKHTTVDSNFKHLFVAATGMNLQRLFDMLAVVAMTLSDLKFEIETVDIVTSKGVISSPNLAIRQLDGLRTRFVNKMLGLRLTSEEIIRYLKNSRLEGKSDGSVVRCSIPRYRTDIINVIDLVEEIAIGHGIYNLTPTFPSFTQAGSLSYYTIVFEKIRQTLIGMELIENLNFSLSSLKVEEELMNSSNRQADILTVQESKSSEHQILRSSLLPSLLNCLSHNIHEEYPQRLFEIGKVFSLSKDPHESWSVCVVVAHDTADYTEIKSIAQTMMANGLGKRSYTRPASSRLFLDGRGAEIYMEKEKIGHVGEIHPTIIENFKIRVPIAAFEIDLSPVLN